METTRIIALNGEVNETSALNVILELLNLNSEDKEKPIHLYINSEGGSILHGLAIYDVIQQIEAPVYTFGIGIAASMGSFLLSCGKKGFRFSLPHSRILIHQPLVYLNSAAGRSQSGLSEMAKSLSKTREKLEKILAENTGNSIETIHADCERDNWMSAEEALKYGLIDKIL